jgi:hypothetical protein
MLDPIFFTHSPPSLFYSTAASKPAAAKPKPVPTYCVNAADAAPALLAVLVAAAAADPEAEDDDALVEVALLVLLEHVATVGSVTPTVAQSFVAYAIVAVRRKVSHVIMLRNLM